MIRRRSSSPTSEPTGSLTAPTALMIAPWLFYGDLASPRCGLSSAATNRVPAEAKAIIVRNLTHADAYSRCSGQVSFMGPMDTKYDEHRRNALVCLRLSHTTSKVAFRESWLKLAQAWMAMIPPDDSGTTEA